MFESAEVGHRIADREYKRAVTKLREELLKAQYDLIARKSFQLIVLTGGVDGAGKSETVNVLNEWMDPRGISTHAFGAMSEDERERPKMWRYWCALPPKGRMAILFGAWDADPIAERVHGDTDEAQFELELGNIVSFERMLANEGALILKFWFHLSKKAQKKRLKALSSDPKTRWRVTDAEWERFEHYDRYRKVSEIAVRETSTSYAPWMIVEGTDANYRYLTVGRMLLEAMRKRLAGKKPVITRTAVLPPPPLDGRSLLSQVDYRASLGDSEYKRMLEKYQRELNLLMRHRKLRRKSVIAVFEGVDAAGKGGSIRRVTGALDARQYQVIPIAAPTDEESARPYLWRFWRHLPRKGRMTIFDRSWYGRVLVERVEKLCAEDDWMRAYEEINDFEEQLIEANCVVTKFWLTISKQEQLKRFRAREKTPFKTFKITRDDWRNRAKWDDYERAVGDMIERTSNRPAPWILVPGNDKHWARISVLKTLCERIDAAL